MDKLSDVIKKRLNHHSLEPAAKAAMVVDAANELLQSYWAEAKTEVRATKVEKGTLTIEVSHATWGSEVQMHSDKLLKALQSQYGDKMVQKIRIKTLTID